MKKTDNKKSAIIPMERYNELLQLEREVSAIRSTKRANTIILFESYFSTSIGSYETHRIVETDDDAIAKLSNELKESVDELYNVKSLNIFQFIKWKHKKQS